MKATLVLLSVLTMAALSLGQPRPTFTPPHKLFAPRDLHVGTREVFTFTSYSDQRFDVKAVVWYENCPCIRNRLSRRCETRRVVFSEDTGKARLGLPVKLEVQMPRINQLVSRRYFVDVTSHNGSVEYYSRSVGFYSRDSFGFLLIKTDKPIYKPSQEVSFCVAFLDKTLKPHSHDTDVVVTIRDSKFKQILKLKSVRIPAGELKCLDFPLADEPNFGTWRIQVRLKTPIGGSRSSCPPLYSLPNSLCSFKVEEFVLPRFEVTLSAPEQLEKSDEDFVVAVTVVYVFGENLQGSVKVNATLESSGRRESLTFYDTTDPLVNGRYTLKIPSEMFKQSVRYRYDPFCTKSSIKVTAEVEEAGRGTKVAKSVTIPLAFSALSVKFADGNSKVFHPGLNYSLKALASLGDGSPAAGSLVRIAVTINNGKRTIFDKTVTSRDGTVNIPIYVPRDANCMKITLTPGGKSAGSCSLETRQCFSPSPAYSPTMSFLRLSDVSIRSPRPNSRVDIYAQSTVPFTHLHLVVISQGSIQDHVFNLARDGVTSATVSFRVTYQMLPKVKVLGVFAREDGELVADLIEVEVRCDLENRVTMAFSGSIVKPGEPVAISAKTTPNSIVLMSVVDKSLTLLAEACKSLEQDNVCRLLRELTRGSLSGGQSCEPASSDRCCPESCSNPTLFGVNSVFSAAGITLYSNMFRPRPPIPIRPPRPVFPGFHGRDGGLVFDDVRVSPTGSPPSTGAPPDGELSKSATPGGRTFFPESWVFQLLKANADGNARMDSIAPDTITTWFGEAISLHRDKGLGFSRQSQITVSKPFFVSLELPFSINYGETVTITPLLFYFGRLRSTVASVSIRVHDDLDIIETTLPSSGRLTVQRGSSSSFSMKLHSRAIGRLEVTISAVASSGEVDVVTKELFVKPGCDKFDITENVFAEEGSGRHCFNYSTPTCVIPGSSAATISFTGDLMSPPDLDRLIVLPTGCGEQTLVRTAVNWVVAEYLVATRQLQDFTAVKIRNNIMIGYQRQLNYLQRVGCFSIWPQASCSLWLTAAVVDVFSGVVDFYKKQAPGTELIDVTVINGGLNYVIRNQLKSGGFPRVGRVHNYGLFTNNGEVAQTAFVLVALKQYLKTVSASSRTRTRVIAAVQRAENYIENEYDEIEGEFCNYALALSTYALHKERVYTNATTRRGLVSTLRSRITTSKMFPGTCFLCPKCPTDSDGDDTSGEADCVGRLKEEGSAACVETSAYALLALREAKDSQFTVCLAQWLIKIRSGSGGFYSSQDTVIAMKALAGFAKDTYTRELNKLISVEIPSLESVAPFTINGDNRYERNSVKVPSVPSTENCVSWSGAGTAIIQSTLTYYGCDCCSDVRAFSLLLATERRDTPLGVDLILSVRISYTGGKISNMALVDVEIPSGYSFTTFKFEDEDEVAESANFERFERRGNNIVFYFSNLSRIVEPTLHVDFFRTFTVDNPKQLPVTVYDYYDPGQSVTKYYFPVTSRPLPPRPPTAPTALPRSTTNRPSSPFEPTTSSVGITDEGRLPE